MSRRRSSRLIAGQLAFAFRVEVRGRSASKSMARAHLELVPTPKMPATVDAMRGVSGVFGIYRILLSEQHFARLYHHRYEGWEEDFCILLRRVWSDGRVIPAKGADIEEAEIQNGGSFFFTEPEAWTLQQELEDVDLHGCSDELALVRKFLEQVV